MPASLRRPTYRSFGHFRSGAQAGRRLRPPSASATPAASVSERRRAIRRRRARPGARTTDTYRPLPGGENHVRAPAPAPGRLRVGDDDRALARRPCGRQRRPPRRWSIRCSESSMTTSRDGRGAPHRRERRRRTPRASVAREPSSVDQIGSISKLMSTAGAECVSAPTETKSAPVAASSGIRSSVTPPEISIFARPPRATDGFANLVERQVVEENRCRRRRRAPRRPAARLCASISIGRSGLAPRAFATAASTPPASRDVVVLDQHRVEQSDAMVGGAAGAHRVFLERAQRRRGLSRVEHGDPPARRVDESARARRDAREPLEKIERGALADRAACGRAGDFRNVFARPTPFAVAPSGRRPPARRRRAARKHSNATSSPAMHAVGLHEEHAASALIGGDRRLGRDVVTSPVRRSSSSARRTMSRYVARIKRARDGS